MAQSVGSGLRALRWLAVLAVAGHALLAASGDGKLLALGLAGDELLVELAKTGPGPSQPGIYAVNRAGQLERVLVYGQAPAWSPDHRRFLATRGGTVWLADLDRQSLEEVDGVGGYVAPLGTLWSPGTSPAFAWAPSAKAFIGWSYEYVGAAEPGGTKMGLVPMVCRLDDVVPKRQRLVPLPGVSIGRLSFSPAGQRLAFERYGLTPDVGRAELGVWLFETATAKIDRLILPGETQGVVLNPLWSSDGQWLSVDQLLPDARRETVILSADLQTSRTVAPELDWYSCVSAVAWSPARPELLVRQGPASDGTMRPLALVSIGEAGQLQAQAQLGDTSTVHQACWSPDGELIAILAGSGPDQAADNDLHLLLSDRTGRRVSVPLPGDLAPVRMDW